MRSELFTLVLTVSTYFGYYQFQHKGRAFYVLAGLLAVHLGGILRREARTQHWIMAGCILIAEGAQQATCGALTYAVKPDGRDLCRAWLDENLGTDLYAILASLMLAGALYWRFAWRRPPTP